MNHVNHQVDVDSMVMIIPKPKKGSNLTNGFRYITPDRQTYEPQHEISNNMVCATSKASDQPAHMRSLIRAFASRLNIL